MVNIGKCTHKVPNGKLLKVTVEFEEERIIKVHVRGDFFIHPEESLDDLETVLKGMEYNRKSVSAAVERFFGGHNVVAFGITPKAVTDALMMCKEDEK